MIMIVCLQFNMKEKDILEHTSVQCHLCRLLSTCRPLCNIRIHLHNAVERTHAKILISTPECHEMTLIVKLLVISVTLHTPQKRVSDTITHVTH